MRRQACKRANPSQDILYKLLKDNDEKILVKKGFATVYSGPKKMGGFLACYRNKTADEWLFVHADSLHYNTAVHYYLPNVKNYQRMFIDKKTLVDGEDYDVLGKTYEQGKVYYQVRYTYNLDLPKPRLDTLARKNNMPATLRQFQSKVQQSVFHYL